MAKASTSSLSAVTAAGTCRDQQAVACSALENGKIMLVYVNGMPPALHLFGSPGLIPSALLLSILMYDGQHA